MQEQMFREARTALVFGVLMALTAACNRDAAPMTACVGDKPAIERTLDVGPPNCPD